MKIAALILGILGGLAGLMAAVLVLGVGGFFASLETTGFDAEGTSQIIGLGWAAIPIAILGIVGGSISIAKPKIAGILMLISGVGGFIAISAGWIIAGILLIIGGILAIVGNRQKSTA